MSSDTMAACGLGFVMAVLVVALFYGFHIEERKLDIMEANGCVVQVVAQ